MSNLTGVERVVTLTLGPWEADVVASGKAFGLGPNVVVGRGYRRSWLLDGKEVAEAAALSTADIHNAAGCLRTSMETADAELAAELREEVEANLREVAAPHKSKARSNELELSGRERVRVMPEDEVVSLDVWDYEHAGVVLKPDKARELAVMLLAAADKVEGKL